MPNRFNPGDIVQLKSGGPKLTITKMVGDNYSCKWFAGAKLETGYFAEDELQPYAEAEQKKPK